MSPRGGAAARAFWAALRWVARRRWTRPAPTWAGTSNEALGWTEMDEATAGWYAAGGW